MNKNTLLSLVNKGYCQKEIAKESNCSPTNVRYWLKKYGIKMKSNWHLKNRDTKFCPRCKESKVFNEFYARRDKTGCSPYCKPCTNSQALERQQSLKKQLVEYKGGKCQICGYDKYVGALEFHHLDPSKKEFTIANYRGSSMESLKPELDKCICVCANCHREVHGGIALPTGLEPVCLSTTN